MGLTITSFNFIRHVLVPKIQSKLTRDLLKPRFRDSNNYLYGHCYVATEALWYMLSEHQRKTLRPHYMKVSDITHWFLMDRDRKCIVDPTAGQFEFPPNYDQAIGCGFLTKVPSKRAKVLLSRLGYN